MSHEAGQSGRLRLGVLLAGTLIGEINLITLINPYNCFNSHLIMMIVSHILIDDIPTNSRAGHYVRIGVADIHQIGEHVKHEDAWRRRDFQDTIWEN